MTLILQDGCDSLAVIWSELLSGTFSILDRMALVAHLRDHETRRYRHHQLAACLESDELDRAIRLAARGASK